MTTKDKRSQNNVCKYDFSNEKTYNDVPCPDGYLIVPIVVKSNDMVRLNQMNTENFKTWRFGGRAVTVAFDSVLAECFDDAMKVFNMDVHEYLSRYTKPKNQVLSLDKFYEDMMDDHDESTGLDPAVAESEVEKLFLMASLDELISEVEQMDARCGKVLRLILSDIDISNKEIFENLGLSKTRGYEVVNKAHELAKVTYQKLNS